MTENKQIKRKKDPISFFFSLGDRVAKTPQKKADFDYYLMWIIFLAFVSILVGNVWSFIQIPSLVSLGWSAFIIGILWFQYYGLKQFYVIRKMLKEQAGKPQPEVELEIESEEEMLQEFG